MKQSLNYLKRFTVVTLLLLAFALASGMNVSAKSIKLNKKNLYMAKGSTYTLKVKGTGSKVKWKSNNKKIVSVSKKGKLKAKKIGKATITAKVKGKKLKCKVVVESKAANKARKLRDYIIKKGKYNKKDKSYTLKYKYMDSSYNSFDSYISAYKKKNTLDFYYDLVPDAPDVFTSVLISIDLISGKASVKTGSAETKYVYDDCWNDDTFLADITTAFDGKGKGFTLNKVTLMEEDYDEGGEPAPKYNTFTDETTLNEYKQSTIERINTGFGVWNKLFKKHKTLKKAKITMKSIGFSKWK